MAVATGTALRLGGIPVRVRNGTWRRLPDVFQGERLRMADNNVVSTEYGGIYIAECEVYFLDYGEEAALRAAVPRGVAVSVTGELVDIDLTALVDIGQTTKKKILLQNVWGLHRVAAIHIEQDEPLP